MVGITITLQYQTYSSLSLITLGTKYVHISLNLGEAMWLPLHNEIWIDMMVGRNYVYHLWEETFNCWYSTLLVMFHSAMVIVKENGLIRGFRNLNLLGMLNKLMHVATTETYLELKWALHELKMSFGYCILLIFISEDCLLLQYSLVNFESI